MNSKLHPRKPHSLATYVAQVGLELKIPLPPSRLLGSGIADVHYPSGLDKNMLRDSSKDCVCRYTPTPPSPAPFCLSLSSLSLPCLSLSFVHSSALLIQPGF